jgi:hypothetical protein
MSDMYVDIGLRAVAFEDPNGVLLSGVYEFTEFCERYNSNLEGFAEPFVCGGCQEASSGLVPSIIISALAILPSMFSDILRMYPNYDVNCQKFHGTIVAALGMIASIYTFVGYDTQCFKSFYGATAPYYKNGTLATNDSGPGVARVRYDWGRGNGLICLYVATFLMIIDVLICLIVPTPTITRDHKEQEEYEALHGPQAVVQEEMEREEGTN